MKVSGSVRFIDEIVGSYSSTQFVMMNMETGVGGHLPVCASVRCYVPGLRGVVGTRVCVLGGKPISFIGEAFPLRS